jgi:hypothetical protein
MQPRRSRRVEGFVCVCSGGGPPRHVPILACLDQVSIYLARPRKGRPIQARAEMRRPASSCSCRHGAALPKLLLLLLVLTASAQAQQARTRTDPVEGKRLRFFLQKFRLASGFQSSCISPSIDVAYLCRRNEKNITS